MALRRTGAWAMSAHTATTRPRSLGTMKLGVDGKFVLDPRHNPPRIRSIEVAADAAQRVSVGLGVWLELRPDLDPLDRLLDARPRVDSTYTGLASIRDACAVICASNHCADWARRSGGRPRIVAKIVGVMADEPRFVLLSLPRLKGAERLRRESRANRVEAGLVHAVLNEPARVECPHCPVGNSGEVSVVDED